MQSQEDFATAANGEPLSSVLKYEEQATKTVFQGRRKKQAKQKCKLDAKFEEAQYRDTGGSGSGELDYPLRRWEA